VDDIREIGNSDIHFAGRAFFGTTGGEAAGKKSSQKKKRNTAYDFFGHGKTSLITAEWQKISFGRYDFRFL